MQGGPHAPVPGSAGARARALLQSGPARRLGEVPRRAVDPGGRVDHPRGGAQARLMILAITLLSAALLAWSAFRTLGPGFALGAERSRMTLRALPAGVPGEGMTMVFAGDLLLDGRHARLEGITRQGTW